MKCLLYVYQNYTNDYSSASLSILRALKKTEKISVDDLEIKPISCDNTINRVVNKLPFLQASNVRKQNNNLIKAVSKKHYDYLFVMKGTDISVETLKAIKNQNPEIELICFNPDDPFNKASSNADIVSSIPLYDYYCIWTKHLDEKLKNAGAKEIIYLPFGIDSEIIYPLEKPYEFDISFVGNGDAERHQIIKDLNDEVINRGLSIRIHIFGSNWPNLGNQVEIHGQRNGIELLKTISASKINLNLLRKQNKNSINMRTFEIPAAHGFMLHEESDEAKSFFKANEEVVYFSSISDLVNKCEFFLKNGDELKRVRENVEKKILKQDYSYTHFIKDRLPFLSEIQVN